MTMDDVDYRSAFIRREGAETDHHGSTYSHSSRRASTSALIVFRRGGARARVERERRASWRIDRD
jgi:hypothetical protein